MRPRRLARGLWGLYVLAMTTTLAMIAIAEAQPDEGLLALLIGYATVGALIASRQPRNAVGWLLLAVALAFAVQGLGEVYVTLEDAPGREYVGWVASWSWFVWMILAAVVLPLLFPTGRVVDPRWRPVVFLGVAALVLSIVGAAFKPGDLDLSAPVQNPFGATGVWEDVAAAAATLGDVFVATAFFLAGASLVVRFRGARGKERDQLKWFVLVGLFTTAALLLAMLEVLFPGGWRRVAGAIGWYGFLCLALIGVPAATGVAILRHRLYDIDVVIRRTIIYGGVTATLVAGYLGCVLLAQLVIGAESDLAIAASTLAMAALFRPARERIQAGVDRRFYRRRYDAARTLEAFGSRLRDELDLETLGADLGAVVRETVQPSHVSVWLRGRS